MNWTRFIFILKKLSKWWRGWGWTNFTKLGKWKETWRSVIKSIIPDHSYRHMTQFRFSSSLQDLLNLKLKQIEKMVQNKKRISTIPERASERKWYAWVCTIWCNQWFGNYLDGVEERCSPLKPGRILKLVSKRNVIFSKKPVWLLLLIEMNPFRIAFTVTCYHFKSP